MERFSSILSQGDIDLFVENGVTGLAVNPNKVGVIEQ